MPTFTSIPSGFNESLDSTTDFIGGTYTNYAKPFQNLTSAVYVKQSGQDIPYTLQDIDLDGQLEIVVGSATGTVLVSYNYQNGTSPYNQAIEITVFNPTGTHNNYITVSNFPIITITTPVTGTIDGVGNQLIRIGNMSGKIDSSYIYDSGELGTMAASAVSKNQEKLDLQDSITSLYNTKNDKLKEHNVNIKFSVFYNEGYDYVVSFPNESQFYQDEFDSIGTWQWLTYGPLQSTWYYYGGNSEIYYDKLEKELTYNRQEITTSTLEGYQQQIKIPRGSLTLTIPASSNYSGIAVPDKAIDGQIGLTNAYQSRNLNPATVYIQLDQPAYLTKIRINPSPESVLERIESVKLSDTQFGSYIELLKNPIDVANEWIDIDTSSGNSLGITIQDDNSQDLIYLPKKQWIAVKVYRSLESDVWINEIEIYKANYSTIQQTFLDNTWAFYNQNLVDAARVYGPNVGWDTIPPTGRATWSQARFASTLTGGPSGGITTRQQAISAWLARPEIQSIIAQVNAEGDGIYLNNQKRLWRDKFNNSVTQQFSLQNSINDNAVSIVKINSELNDYSRYI